MTDKSKTLFDTAKHLIPGGTQLLSKRPDMFSPGHWPTYYKSAKGSKVIDLDGNEYTDMSIAGIGANVLGYSIDDINTAVTNAISNGVSCSLNCYEEVELAQKLLDLHPWAEQVRYARSGGEAMSIAVRIARTATKKEKVAFCGYHGWSDWYLAANVKNSSALDTHLIEGLAPQGVPESLAGTAIPFNYGSLAEFSVLMDRHGHELAAVVMEPFRSYMPQPGYLEEIQTICNAKNIPLIMDEISMGFRICCGGAHLKLGITPDICVLSKALGNGHAIAAILGKEKWMTHAQESFISSTMWTERVGPAAAIATIDFFKKFNVEDKLEKLGMKVIDGWKTAAQKAGLEIVVGGIPALAHFSIKNIDFLLFKSYFIKLMLDRGFLSSNLYYAMYAHSFEDIEKYIYAIEEVFQIVALHMKNNTVPDDVKPATSGFKRLN